jgi:hypothetical protein
MWPRVRLLSMIVVVAVLGACASAPPTVDTTPPTPERPTTAQEVIARNLQAVGGAEAIRAIDTMVISGGTGSALLPSTEDVTLYLARPERFRQQGQFSVLLADGERALYDNGVEQTEITGSNAEELGYRLGFYHHGFSLLAWEESFPRAELVGIKRYGPIEQYQLRLPGAEGGRDLMVFVDAETLLVDRIVFTIAHPEALALDVVNQLRDYQRFSGILMPTRVVYTKVGWEEGPSHFLIRSVEINPPLDDALFADAKVDFGSLTVEDDAIRGEIRGVLDGAVLTNIRLEDMAALGVELKEWIEVRVGDRTIRAKLLDNIQTSATEVKPEEIYLCRYPISRYPRLMLASFGVDVEAALPSQPGDTVLVTRASGPAGDDATPGDED